MPRPFRFGVQLSNPPEKGWQDSVRRIEAFGYSSVFFPDHFGPQWEPVAALAAIAAVTERLKVGSLVYDVDYRHPVILAKASATTHLLSGGRHEFGLGAGWMRTDYDEAGLDYDRPGVRIQRLDEALTIIRSMWREEKTTFEGKYYTVRDAHRAVEAPADWEPPKILIGGGGPRVLAVAGRHADIVGINPSIPEGKVVATTVADCAPDRVRQKVGWVREAASAAGRDPDAIEFNSLVFVVAITDDPGPLRAGIAQNSGMTEDEVADCPIFLTGTANEIRDRLEKRREETGISYVVIQGRDPGMLETFAEQVMEPLTNR
ncbi:MAG: TIGR03621 family F420-dependent LLM class oxidoreductase [Gemmatimonadota bacterium]|nr:TIGR03621 family F420-dependent LLM class oxidoreductase [Gemmatimonadota bacterium]